MKNLRRALFKSVVSLLLCFAMLLGTTYAWFTDSVTSSNNIVKSGLLDLKVYWTDDITDADSWRDAEDTSAGAIFDYDRWEPGFTCVRYIKIVNNGNLAFKYLMNIIPDGEMGILAEVIDVYYMDNYGVDASGNLTSVGSMTKAGTLADVVTKKVSNEGKLMPKSAENSGEVIVAIAMNMQEDADNRYQGESIGTTFSIEFLATQYSAEKDAFGPEYDKDSDYTVFTGDYVVSTSIEVNENNEIVNDTVFASENNEVSFNVGAGAKVQEGVGRLTGTVTVLEETAGNMVATENEILIPVDVHVEGLAPDNTVPVVVTMDGFFDPGLNKGNYALGHVENGSTNAMVGVDSLADLDAHNEYYYDPVTGTVSVALCTFSEITAVREIDADWKGIIADGFAGGEGTEESPYLIANADQLAYLNEVISNGKTYGESYKTAYYKLLADIDLGGEENAAKGIIFYPIGYHKDGREPATVALDDMPEALYLEPSADDNDYVGNNAVSTVTENGSSAWYTYGGAFMGTFDGNGNTIKDIYQNTWQMRGNYDGHYYKEAMGIFGYVYDGVVKNLTVENFTSDGEFTPTGVVAAYAAGNSTFENIAITNCNPRVYNTGNGGIVGVGGSSSETAETKLTFKNITVDNSNKISALWGSWDVACGGIMGMFRGRASVYFENCHVGAQIDVYNDVCGNYQYYWYRYAGMVIGSLRGRNITDANGYTIPDVSGITANNCTVHFGNWNDYYYCELVANTLASYTHDHQFSRLEKIASLDEIKSGNEWTKTGNFLLDGECYHIVNKNGVLTRHLHKDSGYETVNGESVLKEDKQVVYLPFNQLFQGDGWGVKTIGFRNDGTDFDGITILDRDVANSIDKFNKVGNGASFETGVTVTLDQLFSAKDKVSINVNTLKVFVSPVGDESTASAVYTPNGSDWTKGTLTFSGLGVAKIVITDYTYCKEAVLTVNITERQPVDKFEAKDNLPFIHTEENKPIEIKLGDIFGVIDGVEINEEGIEITYAASEGITEVKINYDAEDWTEFKILAKGEGVITVEITDGNLCNPAQTEISIRHPEKADKFIATEGGLTHVLTKDGEKYSFRLGDLFSLAETVEIKTTIVVTVRKGVQRTEARYEPTANEWEDLMITLEEIGEYTVCITDNNYCNLAYNNVSFKAPDKAEKFKYCGADQYYGGTTVKLGDLFTLVDGAKLNSGVTVTVSGGKYTLSENEIWSERTITFEEVADFTVTIKENFTYCEATTQTISVSKVDKFTSNKNLTFTHTLEGGSINKTLGDIFTVVEDATINSANVMVTVDNTGLCTYVKDESDWTQSTLSFKGTGTVKITIKDGDFCNEVEATVVIDEPTPVEKFDVVMNNGDFLHRVGNSGTVALDKLFQAKTGVTVGTIYVTVESVNGTGASGTYANNAIQFSGTGVVKVTITDNAYCIPGELYLEVVDATNLTNATGTTTGGNFVLLCDVNTSTYVNYWNCTLYGNGFTYSLKGAPTSYNSKQGHGVIITKNATLDNLVIVGDIYNSYGAYTSQGYYNAAVDVIGDTVIQNCYISNCSAPVRARNNVTIKNSTLYGGAVANLIIMSGTAMLEDVTTANYDDGRAIVGMGIVIHADATETAKLVLNGTLTQYNFISESNKPSDSNAQILYNAMFASSCSQYQFGSSPNRYVNTGIISMESTFGADDITDNVNTGYDGTSLKVNNETGYVYTQSNTQGSVNNNYPGYKPTTQGAVPPSYSFDYANTNYVAKTEGSNDYCYAENGKVNISMDEGDTFKWDTSILTIGKGVNSYTVSMNGVDYTGKSIAFNTAGEYDVTYTYTDNVNYGLDANGNIVAYSVTYTKTVHIVVAVVKATTKHAEFTFGSSNTASKTVTIGNTTYVMPNATGTSTTIGSTTVSGQTIYYPIVEIVMSDGKTTHSSGWYAYFPVFSGAVTITDYENGGTGDKMTPYNGNTTTMPSGLSVVGDPATLFKYQSGSAAGTSPVVKNNKLVYSSAKIEADRNEYSTVVQYSYTDNAGATYNYYVGYHAPAQKYSPSCVTADTLVTLADGTQVRVDALTGDEMLLVWNHATGSIEIAPVAYIVNHDEIVTEYEVICLTFANGKTVKIIDEHVFFDVTANKYVAIDTNNADSFIGHTFAALSDDGTTLDRVALVSVSREIIETAAYEVVSYKHLTCFTEGILSTSAFLDPLLNVFDVNRDTLAYDAASVQKDIETYGLYTYADFDGLISEEAFELYNAAYLKIAVGKGYITWDNILDLIDIYFAVDVNPLAE